MTKPIPADEGNAQPAASPAGTVAAACVGVGTADNGSGHDEVDEYDTLLASLGRTEEHDQRVCLHELGHFLVNRITGRSSISEVTINPGDRYEGICRGARRAAFVNSSVTSIDASDVRTIIQPQMAAEGEDRGPTADVFQSVVDACTEFMAGIVAEKMLLEGEPSSGSDDLRQATELASLICKSRPAVAAFLAFCERQAFDLLAEHVTLLMGMSIVLRLRRTMTGEELDAAIVTVLAADAAAVERRRRADWRARELAANSFQIECDHVNVA